MPAAHSIPTKPGRASILFGGDTHFGENYFAEPGTPNVLEARGYDYPLAKLRPLTESADLVIVNLETPLTHRTHSPLRYIKPWVHWGDPEKAAEALQSLGIRAVGLANNHVFDALAPGLDDTLSALATRDIAAFGAGPNLARAAEPYRANLVVGRRELRLSVLGAFERTWRQWARGTYATGTGPGTYPLAASTLGEQIRAAKEADPALFVVGFVHWGQNYAPRTPEQSELGHALLDAGADLVVGHGAHRLQPVERYRGRFILYGLGNFVFLSAGQYQGKDPWGAVARLDFTEQDGALSVYFLASDNPATGYQPYILQGDEFVRAADLWLAGSGELASVGKKGHDAVGEHVRLELGAWSQQPAIHE
jgi:hypothetical protein